MYTRVMADVIELGLDTFGDVTLDATGQPFSHAETLRQVVTQAVLADQVGLKFFGVGEHHRKDFAVSAPEVLLAAIAAKTSQIHLGSAVTVLNSDDPDQGLSALFNVERAVQRARRGHRRPRIVHRIVSPVRIRHGGLRDVVRGEAGPLRGGAVREAGDVVRHDAASPPRSGRVPADRIRRETEDLGGRRRHAGFGRSRGASQSAAHARDHRRRPEAVRAVRRSLSSRAWRTSITKCCRSARTPPGMSPPPTSRHAKNSGRTTRR